jgi:hypothetical protein
MTRTLNLRILVNECEKQMVKALARERGLTVADLLRQLIRKEHRRTFPDQHAKLIKIETNF